MEQERKISFALSFVAGFIDTSGFIALFGLFTSHVTGNLVLAGASFFDHNNAGNLSEKLVMLPVFIAGVVFTCYLIQYRKATLSNLIFTEAILISCFSIGGSICCGKTDTPSSTVISLTASFAIIGMAIQNTYMRKLLNQYTPNTVMTGNFTQFSIDLFNLSVYFLKKDQQPDKDAIQPVYNSFKKVVIVLSGFLIGCFLGALLVSKIGLLCCLLPAIILLWVREKINSNGLYKV
ncbi:YoaK family protein [Ferruginibacter paludis]|uniref:YoaK family protein n=1 Tax=Ferruginibacter paludis TaxID=1310417 RepID=UPI0025B35225|nr:YoaK family protein [Ferruginibacter paludis]MDN3656064.1 YoaK family protein [Ferruginibacter paludis]